ncbi:unnamed protein product [Psylliodes chrysocephalus]|uniref:PUM-HD domain-containing protein n=1 Tax=Psylliodes chrysocephalus TaxID=3402493 RepID=A0A9P0GGS3_9CUCU|nr:unnamed protein product [Psylliodes chrysocephala]
MKHKKYDKDEVGPPKKKLKNYVGKDHQKINETKEDVSEVNIKNSNKGGTSKKKINKDEEKEKSYQIKKDVSEKGSKYAKTATKAAPTTLKKPFSKLSTATKFKGKIDKNNQKLDKIEDWTEFKKKKKDLKIKRKQSKDGFDIIVRAKKIGEDLRRKTLKGGEEKRTQLINELHNLLKGKGHYQKFVLAHDTARLVQWLLKYSSAIVVAQISKELIPVSVEMLQSKYGIHCVKRLLKYGSSEIRSQVIDTMFGHSVKLASHSVSAPVVEYAYSTWASPLQKQYLTQEFYGDLYKNSKDNNVKHLRDTYKDNQTLKSATLGATKANLIRILNKSLLDSGLVQTVLFQFLSECSDEDRKEMISQLSPHIVVISNSKDGARAAMQCVWHGSNKDRKIIMKAIKEHITDLCKHEHGHCTVITLLDCIDDTVLLHKVILIDILKNAKDLAINEWGRKVLLWLVAPADSTKFHPVFINELTVGRESSTCKKSPEMRRNEILGYSISTLLELVSSDSTFWLSNASLAIEILAIVKAGSGTQLETTYSSIVEVITEPNWTIKENDKAILGVESAGIHMALKKLAQYDKIRLENNDVTFGSVLVTKLNDEILNIWLTLNRGCFLLVAIFENGSEDTQNEIRIKLKKHVKLLKKQSSSGAKILLKKLS